MSGHHNNPTAQTHPTTDEDCNMVIFDLFPSEALAESQRHLVWALSRLVFDLAYLAFVIVHRREAVALLDSAGGHWPWVLTGAVAAVFLLDELPDAAYAAARASEEFLRVRAYARHVAALPLSQRLLFLSPAGLGEIGEVAPAGVAAIEDASAEGDRR
jgi:hypothetical protein